MIYSENLAELLSLAKDAYKLCRITQKMYNETPGEEDPEVLGLSFSGALEIIRTQQIIKKLDEIKCAIEKLNT